MKREISLLPALEKLLPEYMTKAGDQVSSNDQGGNTYIMLILHVSLEDFHQLKKQRRQVQFPCITESCIFHTILIASLNVTLNSFNLLA